MSYRDGKGVTPFTSGSLGFISSALLQAARA